MKRTLILAGVVLVLGFSAGSVHAQPQNNSTATVPPVDELLTDTPTPTPAPNASQSGERVDGGLTLLSSSYDADAGTATLQFRASEHTSVTLVDAGAFQEGGVLNDRTMILEPGEHTVEFPVTEVDGMVGVSITTDEVVYAEPIVVDGGGLDTPVEMQWVALGVGAVILFDRLRGGGPADGEPLLRPLVGGGEVVDDVDLGIDAAAERAARDADLCGYDPTDAGE
jgi:hypothetical protein